MIKLGIANRLHYSIQHVQPSQFLVARQLDNALTFTIQKDAMQHLRDQRREAAATSISELQQSLNSQPSSSGQHRVTLSGQLRVTQLVMVSKMGMCIRIAGCFCEAPHGVLSIYMSTHTLC